MWDTTFTQSAMGILLMLSMCFAQGCSRNDQPAGPAPGGDLPAAAGDAASTEPSQTQASIVLAGGCFWCVEAVFEPLAGVQDAVSGYAGGTAETAEYRQVARGGTDHAEAVRITYNPQAIALGELLRVFFATHDPTTLNRQGPDTGRHYRSAIFYANDQQKQIAQAYIAQLNQAGVFDAPIVTTLEPLDQFYPAEDYHQNYAKQNPEQPYIRYNAQPKVEKVRKQFSDKLK